MADDGNKKADEALAQAKAKIEELTAKVKEALAEAEKQRKISENAEAKFNEMSNETGENRKAAAEAARVVLESTKARDAAHEALSAVQAELAEAKKQAPNAEDGKNRKDEKPKTADEIEAGLTDAERKFVEERYKDLTDEQKNSFMTDEKVRKEALLQAKETVATQPPDLSSPWKKPAQKAPSGDEAKNEITKLFQTVKKKARSVPDGSEGGSPRSSTGVAKFTGWKGKTTNALG